MTLYKIIIIHGAEISIHTPVKSVTDKFPVAILCIIISIHTPVKSVTRQGLAYHAKVCISIHTPVKSVTA